MKTLGIIFLILGIVLTIIVGIKIIEYDRYVHSDEKEINKPEAAPVYWSPYAGLLLIGVGGTILIYTKKKIET